MKVLFRTSQGKKHRIGGKALIRIAWRVSYHTVEEGGVSEHLDQNTQVGS
jgi:hypothetical protein